MQTTINISHFGASLATFLMGLDPSIGAHTGANALYNNFATSTVEEALKDYANAFADVMTGSAGMDEEETAYVSLDDDGYDSDTGRTACAREAVLEFQQQKEKATPVQREAWKQSGRSEESVFQNAYADKQRLIFAELHRKEARGIALTETERHIKAVGLSQAPEFMRDIGGVVFGLGIARGVGKAANKSVSTADKIVDQMKASRIAQFETKEAGLIYQGGRYAQGTVHSSNVLADAPTLLRGTQANAGNIPMEIGRALEGKTFQSFDQFRSEFWKTVANSKYAGEWGKVDLCRMSKGKAPVALESQQLGRRMSYELHHKTPISQGGATYDLSNITVVTPKFHVEILEKVFHGGGKK